MGGGNSNISRSTTPEPAEDREEMVRLAIWVATCCTDSGELRACLKPPAKRLSSTWRSGLGRGISKEKLPSGSSLFLTGRRTRRGPS